MSYLVVFILLVIVCAAIDRHAFRAGRDSARADLLREAEAQHRRGYPVHASALREAAKLLRGGR